MRRVRGGEGRRKRVRFGAPDVSLTGCSGLVAVTELVDRLGVTQTLDRAVGAIKQRARGLSAGGLLVGMAAAQLLGEDCLDGLDRRREDEAGGLLAPVEFAPSTTAGSLARRFGPVQLAGVESGLAVLTGRWLSLLPAQRRAELVLRRPTIDLDPTDVEVYGRQKRGVAYNYLGQLAGRPSLATWAEACLPLAADLLAGNEDPRPRAAGLLRRALAARPAAVCAPPRVRADAGHFTAELAWAAVEAGADFAIAAPRSSALWRELAAVPDTGWLPARGMNGAQVTAIDYAPEGWPPDTYTIIRRVRVDAEQVSADPRSRRRRTIPKDQLALVLGGGLDHAWATSFIVTNLPVHSAADVVAVEAWFRGRASIEERIREAKLGAGLRHLPSGDPAVNAVWMWAALLAGALSVMLQSLTGLDAKPYRARGARLRHELLRVPARVRRHARGLALRLPPGHQLLPEVLARLRALPARP